MNETVISQLTRTELDRMKGYKELLEWGNQKVKYFRQELKRLGRRNRVSVSALYEP